MKPKIEILTIGNELLEGKTLNTNTHFLCQKLYSTGYLPCSQRSILDDSLIIQKEIKKSLKEFDLVICSGGLGPTQDDLTLRAVSDLFKMPLKLNETLFKKLLKKYKNHLSEDQIKPWAQVPKGCKFFKNHVGMSPGFLFEIGLKKLVLLPGVPFEFEHLVEKEVITFVKTNFPTLKKEFKEIIHLCRVKESDIAPFLDSLLDRLPPIKFGIYPNYGILSIHMKKSASSIKDAKKVFNPYIKSIQKKWPCAFFKGKYSSLQEALQHWLISKKLSLATAESCTGGAIVSSLTKIPGASNYLKGSVVAYCNEIKKRVLNVKNKTLKENGAVSAKCVLEMAQNIREQFQTDIAIAVSGIAGPLGGSKAKPIGTVFYAIVSKNGVVCSSHFKLSGSRLSIINYSVNYILAELWMNKDNI